MSLSRKDVERLSAIEEQAWAQQWSATNPGPKALFWHLTLRRDEYRAILDARPDVQPIEGEV